MAAFCPVFQYHAEYNAHREPSNDRTPWNMQARTGDERVIDTFRHFANVRHNLMPYIWQEAQFSAESGQPMMRALALTHTEASPYQYMFGRDLLVCPIVEPDVARWTVYLPEGTWTDLWTGETYNGGQQMEFPAPIDRIPVFIRAGASIPVALGPDGRLGESVPMSAPASDLIRGA
jgi:alpha-glucosidase (family GH31 glycosyl hydrolase)